MNRPYIFCHMMTALDGKIMGSYMDITPLFWVLLSGGTPLRPPCTVF